jgi:uncharacterized membrane protein
MKGFRALSPLEAFLIAALLWGFAFGIYTTLQLPNRVPVHFGLDGTPNRWGNRLEAGFGLLFLPCIGLALSVLLGVVVHFDAKAAAQKKTLEVVQLGTILLLVAVQFAIAQSYQSWRFDSRLVTIAVGVLLVLIGNIMPKIPRNPYAGVRIPPYTLNSDRAWRAANRAGGWFFVILGIVLTSLGVILPEPAALYGLLLLPVAMIGGLVWLTLLTKREYEADGERQRAER